AQERYSREWWLVGLGATLFWSAVGVIVAAFGAGGAIHGPPPVTGNPPRGRSWALVLFLETGSFLYRLLVGYLMASIVVGVFVLPFIGLGFAFESSLHKFRGTALALAASGAYLGGLAGGTAGGLVGALFAVRSPPETEYGVARWAIIGSV